MVAVDDSKPLNITFSRDAFNSTITDTATGKLLYEVKTPFKLGGSLTTLRDARKRVVGLYQHRVIGHDDVTYKGSTQRVSKWLPHGGWFSSSRRYTAPNGKIYKWQHKGTASLKLVDLETQVTVAESHSASFGLFFYKRRDLNIDVGPELQPYLDTVVLSYLICEAERERIQSRPSESSFPSSPPSSPPSATATESSEF